MSPFIISHFHLPNDRSTEVSLNSGVIPSCLLFQLSLARKQTNRALSASQNENCIFSLRIFFLSNLRDANSAPDVGMGQERQKCVKKAEKVSVYTSVHSLQDKKTTEENVKVNLVW